MMRNASQPRGLPLPRGTYAVAAAAFLLGGGNCFSAEGGLSNYVPGFYGDLALSVAPPDGWSMRNDVYLYGADGGRSSRSGEIELSADVDLIYDYFTLLYKPADLTLFGGEVAFGATLVAGNVDIAADLSIGGQTPGVQDDYTGFGDLTLAMYTYWPREKWHLAWANFAVVPIGAYDVERTANSGLNYWTFETDIMATYFDPEKGRDYSFVFGYLYNTENDDTNYQTGAELHLDVVLNQFLSETMAVGVSGFYWKQVSGDSGSGAVLGPFKGSAAGIGPNFMWVRNIKEKDVAFTLKWIKELNTDNRLEGDHVFASFALSF